MPGPLAVAGVSLGLKALSSLFGGRASRQRNNEQRRAAIAAATLAQKRSEDARRARLDLGSSVLGRIPATTAGGRVNTNVALDPELVARLGQERTYDFAGAIPNENEGQGTSAFLSGLFGGAADVAPYAMGARMPGGDTSGGVAQPGGSTVTPNISNISLEDLLAQINPTGGGR